MPPATTNGLTGRAIRNGLIGESIPLCARIVALADVYDALTSKRVYKEAFTHLITRSMIVEQAGAQFDPDVVDAFVQNEAQFFAIRAQFAETSAIGRLTRFAMSLCAREASGSRL